MTELEMQELMNSVLDLVDDSTPLEFERPELAEGDYYNNQDLLICGQCKHPRERQIYIKGKPYIQGVDCVCRLQKRFEEDKANDPLYQQQLKQNVERIKREGLGGKKYESYKLENDDQSNKKLTAISRAYVKRWEVVKARNLGLLLHGPVGTGKTFYAVGIARELAEQNNTVLVTTIADLISQIQAVQFDKFEQHRPIDRVKSVELLVLDDLGTESGSDYRLEQAYKIIDARYRSGKPIIVTTNIDVEKMKAEERPAYKRLYDRILEMTLPVEVEGASRRVGNSKDKLIQGLEILGIIGEQQ